MFVQPVFGIFCPRNCHFFLTYKAVEIHLLIVLPYFYLFTTNSDFPTCPHFLHWHIFFMDSLNKGLCCALSKNSLFLFHFHWFLSTDFLVIISYLKFIVTLSSLSFFYFCFICLEATPSESQGSLLVVLRKPYLILEIEPGLVTCKDLSIPQILFSFSIVFSGFLGANIYVSNPASQTW